MAYDEKALAVKKPHNIIIEGRVHLSVTGVEDVESFDEGQIVMETTEGNLIIHGDRLHIDKLSLDMGELSVTGLVTDLNYEETAGKGSFWARLFK